MRKDLKVVFGFIPMLITSLILSGCSGHKPGANVDCSNSQTVTVLCESNKITITDADQQPTDETICVNRGGSIQWEVHTNSPDDTKLTVHEFKKKIKWWPDDKKRKPVDQNEYTAEKQNPANANVKQTDEDNKPLEGSFKYSVTCTFEDGTTKKKDPIIEVPKI